MSRLLALYAALHVASEMVVDTDKENGRTP